MITLSSIVTRYIPPSLQVADTFTKPLTQNSFVDLGTKSFYSSPY